MSAWEFEWDEENEEKVLSHGVQPEEVEQCFFNRHLRKRKPRSADRWYLFGRTDGGRALFVVYQNRGSDLVRPITAYDLPRAFRTKYGKSI
jgi:uncharacterized DUF497 family protein